MLQTKMATNRYSELTAGGRQMLLEWADVNSNTPNKNGTTPLFIAGGKRDEGVVKSSTHNGALDWS